MSFIDLLAEDRRLLREAASDSSRAINRQRVVAFAKLSAFVQHWPDDYDLSDLELLIATRWIRDQESSRYFKQRRIALFHLAAAYNSL
jgi:hypothetical protein